MMALTISLPWPDSRLGQNGRGDRRALTSLRRDAKNAGYLLALQASRETGWSIGDAKALRITYEFHPPDRRGRDLDNMLGCMKSCSDGVARAIGMDDAKWREITLRMGDVTKPGLVTMTVEVME